MLRSLASSLAAHQWAVAVLAILLLSACQPIQPQASNTATATAPPATAQVTTTAQDATPDPSTAENALVATWTATIAKEDLLRVLPDFPPQYLCENSGTFVWQFNADGTFIIDQTALDDCPVPAAPHIEDTWSSEGNVVTFAKDTPDEEVYEWAVEDDMLTFTYRSGECPPCMAINTAKPWQRSQE